MFNSSSPIDKLISALESYKAMNNKYMKTQSKVFDSLEIWSHYSNNNAIHDVTIKMEQLFNRLNDDFAKEKSNSISTVTTVFKKFKDFDVDLKKYHNYEKMLCRKEKKYLEKIEKCPSNRSIRDYEIKYEKVKREREMTDLKLFDLSKEIDATKSILFKKGLLNFNETLLRQNEAEKVLLNAVQNLLHQIPDVSNEEVDDISMIRYGNKDVTTDICKDAKKKISSLSVSKLTVKQEETYRRHLEDTSSEENVHGRELATTKIEHVKQPQQRVNRPKSTSLKSRVSCPPKVMVLCQLGSGSEEPKLYPQLDRINEDFPVQPPPTYSDSESQYSTIVRNNSSSVIPSAPLL